MFSFEKKFSKVEEDQFVRVSTLNVLTHFASHKVVSLFYTMTGIVPKALCPTRIQPLFPSFVFRAFWKAGRQMVVNIGELITYLIIHLM